MVEIRRKPAPERYPDGVERIADARPYKAVLPYGDDALAAVAHELRNPLAAILYALEAARDARGTEGESARTIAKRQAARAVRIIDDVFDICAGTRGNLTLHREVVDLAAVVAGAVETTRHLFDAPGHRLAVALPPGPLFTFADPFRLEQVLVNLLANAAKYTEPGGRIELTAEGDGMHVFLKVRDNGRGIDAVLLPRMFDPFQRGNTDGVPNPSGLGLGLSLVKTLVELHGGRIVGSSGGPGCGSEFVVRLPACGS